MTHNFRVGERVVCVRSHASILKRGEIYDIAYVNGNALNLTEIGMVCYSAKRFLPLSSLPDAAQHTREEWEAKQKAIESYNATQNIPFDKLMESEQYKKFITDAAIYGNATMEAGEKESAVENMGQYRLLKPFTKYVKNKLKTYEVGTELKLAESQFGTSLIAPDGEVLANNKTSIDLNSDFFEKVEWRPRYNETYFYINSYGEIVCTFYTGNIDDVKRISVGNYFRTREAAEKQMQKEIADRKTAERG